MEAIARTLAYSRCADQGPRVLGCAVPDRRCNLSKFPFHRLLLGVDGWGKFDDHNWGLLEDY